MLKKFYNGKVIPWERHNRCTDEQRKILDKIVAEENYITTKLSPEDCERFKGLTELYTELSTSDEGDIFAYGFSIGLLLMVDVMNEAKAIMPEDR